ncbi:MAG TPA: protein phosphatase 2C domain-containing protein [Ktedonobacteraceae bacterium]
MICPTCNTANRDDAKFCKVCGRSLATAAVAASSGYTSPAASVPALDTEPASSPVDEAPIEVHEDDISQEPTLIISPDKMIAYHQRLWRESAPAPEDENDAAASTGAAEAEPSSVPEPASSSNGQEAHDPIPIPPPPPPESLTAGDTEMEGTEGEEIHQNGYLENAGYPEMESSNTMPDSSEQQHSEQPQTTGSAEQSQQADEGTTDQNAGEGTASFPVLAAGTTLQDRYEITALAADNGQEHVYQVVDHQGYQRCWNCKSENNTETDDFCSDCGASLRDIPYLMHEYSAEQSKEDTPVLQGNIANTFVDQGRTYVIEQHEAEQNAFPNGVHLLAASHSDAGNVRRSDPNEDSALILQLQRIHESLATPVGVYIVADGMGGHDNGQLASRMTINTIAQHMTQELLLAPLAGEKDGVPAPEIDEESLEKLLRDAIEEANTALCEVNARNKTDMGSTLTGFMIVGQHAFIVNVGDSRTYMIRGGQLYQLTTDHSLVGQLVASGLIEPDDVYTHPQRSQIYRSLGDKPNTPIDITKQQLHPGDKLVACCDGLWEMVRNPQIEGVLNTAPDPQTACQQLIDLANENGGEDNITAVIVYVQ